MKPDEIQYGLMKYMTFFQELSQVTSAADIVLFLQNLFDREPALKPARFDPYGPVRTKYTRERFTDLANDPEIVSHLEVFGPKNAYHMFRSGNADKQEYWVSDFDITQIPVEVVLSTADYMVKLPSDLATLHAVSAAEVDYCKKLHLILPRRDGFCFQGLPLGHRIFGLPTLAWRTYFGPMYIRHFGRERLMSAPAIVREVAGGHICIQLSESIGLIESDWPAFQATRERVIEHLGRESFQRVRGPGDPPPMGEFDRNGVPGTAIPPELAPFRRQAEEHYKRARLPKPPEITRLDELLEHPKRFRVVQLPTKGKGKRANILVVDTACETMIGFADDALRDHYVKRLIEAGAEYKKFG